MPTTAKWVAKPTIERVPMVDTHCVFGDWAMSLFFKKCKNLP